MKLENPSNSADSRYTLSKDICPLKRSVNPRNDWFGIDSFTRAQLRLAVSVSVLPEILKRFFPKHHEESNICGYF